ncbi:MAG: AAA family ATPase, partial [Pseudomonadota bacterium]
MDGQADKSYAGLAPLTDHSQTSHAAPGLHADSTAVGLEALTTMADRAALVVDRLRSRVFAGQDGAAAKTLDLRFNVKQAAAMVGRSDKLIRHAEANGRLPPPTKNPASGRRTGYSLAQVNEMRRVFGTRPWRVESDPAMVLAIQSFKGGVGKTALTCHLAQYLALCGYRVCVIDCDSQASATSIFGLNPDADIDEDQDTLYPFFRHGGPASLDYALRP